MLANIRSASQRLSDYFFVKIVGTGKTYDVDEIELTFFNANGELTGQETIRPRLGENASGQNANNIVAEVLTLSSVYTASRMTALLRSDNGQIDFQNFVVRAA